MNRMNLSELTREYSTRTQPKEGDRLSLLSQISQLRKVIAASLHTLSPLENPELAGLCTSEDLEEINGHLQDAARDLKKMLEYFLSQAKRDIDINPLAV